VKRAIRLISRLHDQACSTS